MKQINNQSLKKYSKNALLGMIAILVYFILPEFQGYILEIFNIDADNMSIISKIIYIIIYYVLIMGIIILIHSKKLKKDFKDIKNNHKEYFKTYFKYWLIGLEIMMISNMIITLISNNNLPSNEETIRELFSISPIYVYFSAVIYAPVVEELIFRQSIRNIVPNNILFIILSGLVFGGLHVIGDINSIYDLLYIIPYSTPGFIFAYILTKTDNIFVSMGLHFTHNGLLIAIQFLGLFTGVI